MFFPKFISNNKLFYIFNPIHSHQETALRTGIQNIQNAGFVRLNKEGLQFYGSSVTLSLNSEGVQSGIFENLYFLFKETPQKWLYLEAICSEEEPIKTIFEMEKCHASDRYLYVKGKKIHSVTSDEFNTQNVIPIPQILLHDKKDVIAAIEKFFCMD